MHDSGRTTPQASGEKSDRTTGAVPSETQSPAETVVLRVGGSLLDLPELPARLGEWLRHSRIARPLVIVGGGAVAEAVRNWDRTYRLGEERAHQLAVESMRLTRLLLLELLENAVTVRSRASAAQAWEAGKIPILNVAAFLQNEEAAAGLPLPHSWSVTSDSIAAWVARIWPADRLVLVKSVPLPEAAVTGAGARGETGARGGTGADSGKIATSGLIALADNGITDSYLPILGGGVPEVGWLFLRNSQPVYQTVLKAGKPPEAARGRVSPG